MASKQDASKLQRQGEMLKIEDKIEFLFIDMEWNKDTYDLFIRSAKQADIKLPRHKVLVLQDIIGLIATSQKEKMGFEKVLIRADISYNPAYLHYSKHDVQYLFALYKKMYADYQELTSDENAVVNEKTKIIHTPECRYAKQANRIANTGVKKFIFRGYRVCNCCSSQLNMLFFDNKLWLLEIVC